jgi:hypothetical protein
VFVDCPPVFQQDAGFIDSGLAWIEGGGLLKVVAARKMRTTVTVTVTQAVHQYSENGMMARKRWTTIKKTVMKKNIYIMC